MSSRDLKAAYRHILDDPFPAELSIHFGSGERRQTLVYEKVTWRIGEEVRGLRYGENPDQPAALYRLVNGNLVLGNVASILPGRHLASDPELLQSGKHPGKINLTDADRALDILRHLHGSPCAVIVKHNNPCGVAKGATPAEAYHRANKADRLAAFGGCIALNREVDRETARLIAANFAEVVVAPEFADGVMEMLAARKNLRVMRIADMARLENYACERFADFKSLIDGGLIVQWSFVPAVRRADQFLPAECVHQGRTCRAIRRPDARELDDMLFGWLVETGINSNSVIYVKDGATAGIGAGEQDRVGVAEIARDKAYRKLADWLSWERFGTPYNELADPARRARLDEEVAACHGGLEGSCMISDGFFPFRDGVEVGIREGVTAILQPGGSLRDWDVIECCNDAGVAMLFTGQRCFRH